MPKPPAHHRSLLSLLALALAWSLVGARTAADSQSAQRQASAASAHEAAAAKSPLYLEVRANLRGRVRGPFVPDMKLAPGTELALQARTSGAARVYLLHCDAHAALSVFPDAAGIVFRADQWVTLPAADMPIRLGSGPGSEAVYVIATRDPLAQSDALLARWLSHTMQEPQAARCDGTLAALLAGQGAEPATGLPPTAANPPPRKLPYALRGVDISRAESTVARAFAQGDGVVILRFAYVIAP